MAKEKIKIIRKIKIHKKIYTVFIPSVSAVVFVCLLIFLSFKASYVPEHEIYVSSEVVKPGHTVLVKVSGKYPEIEGSFNGETIDFFRIGKASDWIAFLGIDVKTPEGKYKIFVNVGLEAIEKEINVEPEKFTSVGMPATKELALKGYTPDKAAENIVKTDNPTLNQILTKFTPRPYFSGSFAYPLSKIRTSGLTFGEFAGKMQHFGVDLRASTGTNVYAINDGKIVFAKEMTNYGKTIVIDHGLGIFSLYLHLDKFKTEENQTVKKGQIIGLSGNTGYSTASHLHFSIRDNKARVDPLSFIEATQQASLDLNLASIENAFSGLYNKLKIPWILFQF